LQSLLQTGLYKSSQGRVARQLTFAAIAATVLLATWSSWVSLDSGKFLALSLNWVGSKVYAPDQKPLAWTPGDKESEATARIEYKKLFRQGYRAKPLAGGVIVRSFTPKTGKYEMVLKAGGYRSPGWLRESVTYGLPTAVLLLGCWGGYRLVNYPRFADFLIAVEAEMNKVTWPSRGELTRSSLVVIFVIFFLAFILAAFDTVWIFSFTYIGILRGGGA